MENVFSLLGLRVQDKVTGFAGVVVSITFDLYGCVQALVHPGIGADGKLADQMWFDVSRLSPTDTRPVMPVPAFAATFSVKGPEAKPPYSKA